MRSLRLSVLLLALLAGFSGAIFAAEPVKAGKIPVETSTSPANVQVDKVNLNTADLTILESELIGIGKVKAEAIIEHRTANGPFASVDELLEVKGIGAATLEKNRDRLSVN